MARGRGAPPRRLLTAAVRREPGRELTPAQAALRGIEKPSVPRSAIPAVTHVDGPTRVQTVRRETSPLFHAIPSAFRDRTGCPVLVNTSFNVRAEPIVCTPDGGPPGPGRAPPGPGRRSGVPRPKP